MLVTVEPVFGWQHMSGVTVRVIELAHCAGAPPSGGGLQPFRQLRPASPARYVADRNGHGLLLSDQHNKLLTARNTGVEQVPLQHRVVLRHHGNDDGGVLRTLALVDARRIGRDEHVEFAKSVGHGSAVEANGSSPSAGSTSLMLPTSP